MSRMSKMWNWAPMKSAEQAFVLATVVRTVSVTAAKARRQGDPPPTARRGRLGRRRLRPRRGAKGGARGLADGEPRMVSVQPEDMLAELGVKPGENREGIRFAGNMCPSKGTMDIFVEPVLPHPSLLIFGASPVAMSLAAQARQLGYHVTLAAPATDPRASPMRTSLSTASSRAISTMRAASSWFRPRARAMK